mmetsp:Transcript_112097/g.356255  ORF Transcript_112097/g.356255 Transcript_112097/m.356255 type:complete len:477 (-) Transcript_112097:162-1592(-)
MASEENPLTKKTGSSLKVQRAQDHYADRSAGRQATGRGGPSLSGGPSSGDLQLVANALEPGLETEGTDIDFDTKYYAALLMGSFMVREGGSCDVESGSAYGAALMLPQLARSAGWPLLLTGLSLRAWIFLVVNICMQYSMLMLISREENVLDTIAGQMNLCNFGAGSRGPLGTEITPERTYSWDQWITRVFVKDSLKALFPHRLAEIEAAIDPGEYALESRWAREICCFIFIIATMGEFLLTINMGKLLYMVPTKDESWLTARSAEAEATQWHEDDAGAEGNVLDKVKIQVAGIPRRWKIFYCLFLLLPKAVLWYLCCRIGVEFLMETSTIAEVIVNAVAMTFILYIDEMMCSFLMSQTTRSILSRCEEFVLYDVTTEGRMTDQEIMLEFCEKQKWKYIRFKDFVEVVPGKLLTAVLLTAMFIACYFWQKCDITAGGEVVSRTMYKPTIIHENFLQVLFPSLVPRVAEPFWEMPEA